MASNDDVSSFFRTKLAQDPVIDPGEAAMAGLTLAAGPLIQRVLPFTINYATGQFDRPIMWSGDQFSGMSRLSQSEFEKGWNKSKKILDIFDVKPGRPVAADVDPKYLKLLEKSPIVDPKELEYLQKISKSVNSMLDKYDLGKKGVKIDLTSGPLSRLRGPDYDPASKRIRLPRIDKDTVLHEIGHAAHRTRPFGGVSRFVQKFLHKGSNLAIPMAYVAGDEIREMFPGKVDDKAIKFIQDNAPAILASTYAASEIYPEVQATTRAVKHVYDTEGSKAAKKTLKRLIPPLLGYTLPIIPTIVGIGLARKWHKEAKEEKEALEKRFPKQAGFLDDLWDSIGSPMLDYGGHAASQIADQAREISKQNFSDVAKKIYNAGIKTIRSPSFASGAAMVGIPAATLAYVKYNTPHGKMYTERTRQFGRGAPESELSYYQEKVKEDSITPAIIGVTAALSGGFLNKLFTDIYKVM